MKTLVFPTRNQKNVTEINQNHSPITTGVIYSIIHKEETNDFLKSIMIVVKKEFINYFKFINYLRHLQII